MKYLKTYGIIKSYSGRYNVCSEISDDKRYYYEHTSLSYKKPDFAIKQAESFVKACHKNHIGMNGEQVTFEFKNMGIIA